MAVSQQSAMTDFITLEVAIQNFTVTLTAKLYLMWFSDIMADSRSTS